jgi:hypothetical protein
MSTLAMAGVRCGFGFEWIRAAAPMATSAFVLIPAITDPILRGGSSEDIEKLQEQIKQQLRKIAALRSRDREPQHAIHPVPRSSC